MNKRILLSFLWVVIFSAAITAQTKYNLTIGDSYLIESTMNQVISQMVMGSNQEIENTSTTTEKLEVTGFGGGEYTLTITNLKQLSKVKSPMGIQTIDSEDETTGEGLFAALKNTTYSFTMDEYGKIIDIIGLDELQEKVNANLGNNSMLANQVGALFNTETIRNNLETRFTIYSPTGETSWTKNKEVTMNNLPFKIDTQFELTGDNSVKMSGDLSVAGSVTQMGMVVDMEMSGTQSGTYQLMEKSGMPSSVVSSSNITGSAKTQGMTIPMTITAKNDVTFTKQ